MQPMPLLSDDEYILFECPPGTARPRGLPARRLRTNPRRGCTILQFTRHQAITEPAESHHAHHLLN
jgi:hypothetical protein